MILGIQILGVLFGLFMIYLTFLNSKRGEFTFKEWAFWSLLWVGFIFVTLFPSSLNFAVKGFFKLKRPLDFYIIIGFMFLTGAVFYTYSVVRKNQKRLEILVRKLAIREKE